MAGPFDDVTCSAYLIPDTLDAMPTQLSVRFACSEMAPGTADSVIVLQCLLQVRSTEGEHQ